MDNKKIKTALAIYGVEIKESITLDNTLLLYESNQGYKSLTRMVEALELAEDYEIDNSLRDAIEDLFTIEKLSINNKELRTLAIKTRKSLYFISDKLNNFNLSKE